MVITKMFILISLLSLLTSGAPGPPLPPGHPPTQPPPPCFNCKQFGCFCAPPRRRRAIEMKSDINYGFPHFPQNTYDATKTHPYDINKAYNKEAIIEFFNDIKEYALAENKDDISKFEKYMNNFSNDVKYCIESTCYGKNEIHIAWNGLYKSIDFDIDIMDETFDYVEIEVIAITITTQGCKSTMLETAQISYDDEYKIKMFRIISREDENDVNTCDENEDNCNKDDSLAITLDSNQKRLLSESGASNIECYSCNVESTCPYSGKQKGQQCQCYSPTFIKVSSDANCASMISFDGVSVAWWCDDTNPNCLSCE